MGQQLNKVQKRRRRLNYQKRKKLAAKASVANAKPASTAKTSASAKKSAAKPAAAGEKSETATVHRETLVPAKE
jgi:hypothetical protein